MDKPIFILGMPRSGTKLLRDILNNNNRISIPVYESLFIPYFIKKYGMTPNFDNKSINEIIFDIKKSLFYYYAKKGKYHFNENHFKTNINYNSLTSIIKYILQNFSKNKGDDILWGDKTPRYINHITTLYTAFPNAKFIHIVRDPRDIVISAKNAWNKNVYRASQRWNKSITNFKNNIDKLNIILIEIKYEDLLDNPENIIENLCKFLEVEFDDQMLILTQSTENIGSAKNKTKIVKSNKNKYIKVFKKKQINKIEELCFAGLKLYEYKPLYAKNQKYLSKCEMYIFKLVDIINRIFFNLKSYGFINGMKFSLSSIKKVNY